jgi:hypothetical protein
LKAFSDGDFFGLFNEPLHEATTAAHIVQEASKTAVGLAPREEGAGRVGKIGLDLVARGPGKLSRDALYNFLALTEGTNAPANVFHRASL